MKNKILSIIVITIMVFSTGSVMSQPPPGPPPPPPPPNGTAGPIDSGSLVLLLAVAGYGYLQLKKKDVG